MQRLMEQYGLFNQVREYSSSSTGIGWRCRAVRDPDQGVLRADQPTQAVAGLDVQAMYPAKAGGIPTADNWT